MSNNLYKKIENYVTGLFDKTDPSLKFHNLKHTQTVVERTKEIAGHYHVTERNMLTLFAAAWFHDTGHLFTDWSKHEKMSAEVMRKYMTDQTDDKEMIDEIEKCIMATKAPRDPKSQMEEIICDADTYHLGTKDFKETNKQMFNEWTIKTGNSDKIKFNAGTLKMLEEHKFYTDYCKDLLNQRKEQNMKKIKNKLDKKSEKKQDEVVSSSDQGENLANIEKDKTGLMSKGIQTMLRLTSENHLKLSDMADHKAGLLINVNSIIISIILGILLRKLQDEPYLTIPSIIFLLVAVTTIVLSILATRPKITGGTFTHQDILDKKTNLLFFGNFYRASFENYNVAMRNMMVDTDYLYGSLIKDIYYLGVVLGRKYRLIRWAYNIFMVGIIVSVIAFAISILLHHGSPSSSNTIVNGTGSPF
ncbi:MAG: Pycsar system effector family protein [Ginsengibacter sp.]